MAIDDSCGPSSVVHGRSWYNTAMGVQTGRELMDVLRELPPLMPKFLQRRRVGVPVVGELAASLGIERFLIFTLLQVDTTQSIYNRDEVTLAELRAYNPYQVIRRHFRPARTTQRERVGTRKRGWCVQPVIRCTRRRGHAAY